MRLLHSLKGLYGTSTWKREGNWNDDEAKQDCKELRGFFLQGFLLPVLLNWLKVEGYPDALLIDDSLYSANNSIELYFKSISVSMSYFEIPLHTIKSQLLHCLKSSDAVFKEYIYIISVCVCVYISTYIYIYIYLFIYIYTYGAQTQNMDVISLFY